MGMRTLIYPTGGVLAANTAFVTASLAASLTCTCARLQRGTNRYSTASSGTRKGPRARQRAGVSSNPGPRAYEGTFLP